jgi:hypothetical protein
VHDRQISPFPSFPKRGSLKFCRKFIQVAISFFPALRSNNLLTGLI